MRRLAAGLLALLAPGVTLAQSPEQVLHECARSASGDHRGLAQLARDCPGLDEALAALGLEGALARGEDDRLEATSLSQLLPLLREPAARLPDVSRLGPVLREMDGAAEETSWWDRFKRWVERALTPGGGGEALPGWLTGWLQRLEPGELLLRGVALLLVAGVIGLALWVIWRELRAQGLIGPRTKRRLSPQPQTGVEVPDAPLARQGPPSALQARALFRYVTAWMIDARRLPAERSLTHRELARAARLDAPEQQEAWRRLAGLAEREAYADPQLLAGDTRPVQELEEAAAVLLAPSAGASAQAPAR